MATNNVDIKTEQDGEIFSISGAKQKINELEASRKELSEKLVADQNKLNETMAEEIKCLKDMTEFLESQLNNCKTIIADHIQTIQQKNQTIIQIRESNHQCRTNQCSIKTILCWDCTLEK